MVIKLELSDSKKLKKLVTEIISQKTEWKFLYEDKASYNYSYKAQIHYKSKVYNVEVTHEHYPGHASDPYEEDNFRLRLVSQKGRETILDDGDFASDVFYKIERKYKKEEKADEKRWEEQERYEKLVNSDTRKMRFSAEYKISFILGGANNLLVEKGRAYFRKKYKIAPKIKKLGGKSERGRTYLEFEGDWKKIAPLHHLNSDLNTVAVLQISEGVPEWFTKLSMNQSDKVQVVDTLEEMPDSLEKYLFGYKSNDIKIFWPRSFVPEHRWLSHEITFQRCIEEKRRAVEEKREFAVIRGKGHDVLYVIHNMGYINDLDNGVTKPKDFDRYDKKFAGMIPFFTMDVNEKYFGLKKELEILVA